MFTRPEFTGTTVADESLDVGRCLMDGIEDISMYQANWQRQIHSGWKPNQAYQSLPLELANGFGANADLPDLSEFKVSLELSQPSHCKSDFPFEINSKLRRDCFLYFYLPLDCPCGTKCANIYCPFAHSILEKSFHPIFFRTILCERKESCDRKSCSFLHQERDDIQATNLWLLWEEHWNGWRSCRPALEEFCREIVTNPEKSLILIRSLWKAMALRLDRATSEERDTLEIIENMRVIYFPFEQKLAKQPLNPLFGIAVIPKVLPVVLEWVNKTNPDRISLNEMMLEKRDKLKQYWTKIILAMRSQPSNVPIAGKNVVPREKPGEKSYERLRRESVASTAASSSQRGSVAESVASVGRMSLMVTEPHTIGPIVRVSYDHKVSERMNKLKQKAGF